MGEYYGVVRAPNRISHALERGSGAVAVYKNHKYLARAMTTSGKYRYFYDTLELAAYKQQRSKQTNSLTKVPGSPSSSQSKSLRERWEERRDMLGATGSGGSGGSGGGGGRSGSGSSGGGSGRGSKKLKVINRVKPQEGPKSYGHLSAGALKNQGENTPVNEPTKTKKKKQTRLRQIVTMRGGVPTVTVRRDYRR